MSNHHTLTKRVDHSELLAAILTEGVTSRINIDHEKVTLHGPVWDAFDAAAKTTELAKVATAETAHTPTTLTEVTLQQTPHNDKLLEELQAAVGAMTGLSVELPASYPGTACLFHDSLSSGDRTILGTAATDHDPTTVPSLSLDVTDLQVLGNGVSDGTITVTDSREAAAENVVLDVIPPLQPVALDKTSITLDALGKGTLKFGPSPAAGYVSGKLPVGFRYQGAGVIGNGTDATVQYT